MRTFKPLGARSRWLWALIVLISSGSWLGWRHASDSERLCLQLQSPSCLYLEGSSNVVGFNCLATRLDSQVWLEVTPPTGRHAETSLQGQLRLPVGSLDCGQRPMNRDLQSALRAEAHPYLYLDLLKARLPESGGIDGHWRKVAILLQLQVSGACRSRWVEVSLRRTHTEAYHLRGRLPLRMTDFGVEPPTALGGMIKVDDEIVLHFDLRARCR